MASADESVMDWVQLNYQNVENKRIPPITWKIPKEIREQWAAQERRARVGYAVIMMSQLRRKFENATSQRPARSARDNNKR